MLTTILAAGSAVVAHERQGGRRLAPTNTCLLTTLPAPFRLTLPCLFVGRPL
jgi:hypothetical protein